jgi:TonB-dependent starch-binding outer membrane protein SusC
MKKFLLLCFSFVFVLSAWAQDRVITGKVSSSEDGSALPGVNVVVKGTTNGTVTDADGKYSLSIPSSGGSLVFSFIGLKTSEVPIGERSIVDVQLGLDVTQLSEIVVTGVGVATEKRKLPIEVATMGTKDFPQSAVGSLDQVLQGKISGAQIQLTSGAPGSAANIQLRGINSLGSTQPIVLLDGVQISAGNGDSPLQGLDMTNVERIEVVKGAAAGMLYGAQGANGVIQIFSKKGSRDRRVNITVGSKIVIDEIIRGDVPLNAQSHYFQTDSQGFIIDGSGARIAPNANGTWTSPASLLSGSLKNDKPYKEATPDHLSQAYRQAVSTNSTVNISGGSEKLDYSLNVNYLKQQNVRFGELERTNIGLNIGTELVKGLTLRSTTQLQLQQDNLLSGNRFAMINNDAWVDFNATLPTGFKVIKPRSTNEFNPLSELEWRTRNNKDVRVIQNFNFNYKFPKFLTLDYKYGIQYFNSNLTDVTRSQAGFVTPASSFWGPPPGTGQYFQSNSKSVYQNSLLTALINFDFKEDFGFNVPIKTVTQLTYDYRKDENSYFSGTANGFNYPPYNLNNGTTQAAFSNEGAFTTYGYLINQTIEYGDIAGISVGYRSDYSSEFGFSQTGTDIKPFGFGRGTAYFNISQLISAQFLTNWKLRAAYGEAGVQPFNYARQDVLSSQLYGSTPGLFNQAVARNPALKVQTTKEIEVGTDFTITPSFSDRWLTKIDVAFTYWDRKSNDIIQQANQGPTTGVSAVVNNNISLGSKGVDISVDLGVFTSTNFSWNLGARIGTAETLVDKLSLNIPVPYGPSGLFLNRVGAPLGIMSGQYAISSLDAKRPDGTPYITTPADFSVVNTQYGSIVVNNTSKAAVVSSSTDLVDIGNPQPSYFGSLINDFTFLKNFQLNMQWDFMVGNKIYNQTRQWLYRDNISKDFDLPITVAGESGAWVQTYASLYNSVSPISWFVEDGSYARLRNLSLTYNLGSAVRGKWAKQISLNFAARNLFTITSYRGLDPESVSSGSSVSGIAQGAGTTFIGANQNPSDGPARGIDSFNFPNLRSYQFGVTIGL